MNDVATFTQPGNSQAATVPTGRLLINDADEIIYANSQARHFLGFLTDELLPNGQKFLPLVRAAYACYPPLAWTGWPKLPSVAMPRYLIYTPPNNTKQLLLQVEITEHIILENRDIWVITINLVDRKRVTAVSHATV